MNKTHPAFWGFGWAGVFAGAVLVVIGITNAAEVAQMAGGYGLMMIGSALYLLAGLKLRERLGRRVSMAVGPTSAPAAAPAASRS
ncbi:MAG TPA: hypothetical protein VFK61_08560 [Candidatus Limnocylindria bacterium]|nr:hypothetical protein [Candidatus Limnocylindria bacterium]